jgi:hypothetical protein
MQCDLGDQEISVNIPIYTICDTSIFFTLFLPSATQMCKNLFSVPISLFSSNLESLSTS